VPFGAKVATIGVLLCGLLAGGLGAADRVTSSSGDSNKLMLQSTVEKLVTVREKGRIVVKLVPVAEKKVETGQRRETLYKTEPKYVTRVVSADGDAHVRTVAKLVPVVTTRQFTPQAVGSTRPITRTETAALTRTVTNTQNITQPAETITTTTTNTLTKTETRVETTTRTATQTLTETRVETVTLPAEIVTVAETVTVTVPKPK
jgi:hypothetical protein